MHIYYVYLYVYICIYVYVDRYTKNQKVDCLQVAVQGASTASGHRLAMRLGMPDGSTRS